jgi:serine protease AprX
MQSRISLNHLLIGTLLLALLPTLAVAGSPPPQAEVHPLVWEILQAEGEAQVLVVLRAQADLGAATSLRSKEAKGRYVYETLKAVAEETQRDLRATLDAFGVDYQPFFIVNAIKVQADHTLLDSLAARPEVERIVPNPWVKGIPDPASTLSPAAPDAIEPNLDRVHAPEVWALGYTGQGVVVAGNDTGIQWDHPALIDHYREQQPGYERHDFNWHDAINNLPTPYDGHSHGTHTVGTIVGDDGDSNQIGMAPGAKWIGCKNMTDSGLGSPASYIECFEFLLAPYAWNEPDTADPSLAPSVINNSWSCPPSEGCDPDTLEEAVDALRQAGVVVVVSAGNSGYSGCSSVNNPPAIYQQSFTTGGFDHDTDEIASFSSRGPVTYGGETYIKPQITAPGVGVRSSVPPSTYGSKSGTSMAAPHVTGAVALLLSAAPDYDGQVEAIEYILTSTAEPKLDGQCGDPGPPNNVWGWGILNAQTAIETATGGSLQGTVTDANSGEPIAGAQVLATLVEGPAGPMTITQASGQYTLTLAMGEYGVAAQATGYLSHTVSNVFVTETTTLDLELLPLQSPEASFDSNSPIYLGETLILTNTSTAAQSWSWDLGDGQTSTVWEPSHVYTAAGSYTVTLVVTNAVNSDTFSDTVIVQPLSEGMLQGQVTDRSNSVPIEGAEITARPGASLEATTDPVGHYTLLLPSGTYSVTADATGYLPETITNVIIISGETTIQDFALVPAQNTYLPLIVKEW